MEKKTILTLLILILLLGSFLRIYNIGNESFWGDESATVYTTQQKASDIIEDIYTTSVHASEYFESGGMPPFYFVIANYWTRLVGLSEAKLRFLSAIFGVISIYIVFLIGKAIFDNRVGLVSALIVSINYLHIQYSQEARPYSLVVLLTLLTVYFIINALKQQKIVYWFAYTLSAVLLIYTHYFGFFILLFEYLYVLIFWKTYKRSFKNIILSSIGIFILYLPWIPALFRQITESTGWLGMYLGRNIMYNLIKIFIQFNSWFTPDFQTRTILSPIYHGTFNIFNINFLSWITIISVLLLTALLSWYFIKAASIKNKNISIGNLKDRRYIFLLLWFLMPILIPIAITLMSPQSPIFGLVKYVIFASPAYYLIASKGIIDSKRYSTILVLLIILSILPLHSYYSNVDKQQWKETAEYLKNNRTADQVIFVNMPHSVASLSYYYEDVENIIGIRNVDELIRNIDDESSFWYISTSEVYGDPKGEIKGYLDVNYRLKEKTEFVGIKIFHYTS